MNVNVNDDKARQHGLDPGVVRADIEKLLRSGMPDSVAMGFMIAKLKDQRWDEVRRIVDELGEQAHHGDPVKKARVEHFNEIFLAELKKQQGLS